MNSHASIVNLDASNVAQATRRKVDLNSVKVAIVHDWLTAPGGAEKVLAELITLCPQADIFTLVDFLPEEHRHFLTGKKPRVSFIQRMPFARKRYRSYLPLMPAAIEQFDLSGYDVVLSSSYAVAKGVITGPTQTHIAYIHSPPRYAWDLQHRYLRERGITSGLQGIIAKLILHYLRMWDVSSSNSPDVLIANSRFIASRIQKYYRRDADIIHPPVDLNNFDCVERKDEFYLTASRMVPYKMIPLIVEAFAKQPQRKLVVIGDGPEMGRALSKATPNIQLLGYQPNNVLADYMQRARAFIFAAEEDFGIVPLEAQASGTPVIAYARGGALETVIASGPDRTGLFFAEQTVESLIDAVDKFEALDPGISASACRQNAERFSAERFREAVRSVIEGYAAR